jgi:hypothetical protein
MQQKYVYAYNGAVNWVRGLLSIPSRSAPREVNVYQMSQQGQTLLWRNHFT